MNVNFDQLRGIFLDVVEHHPPDQWEDYLDQACGGDPELRRQVGLLLKAHAADGSLRDVCSRGIDETARYGPISENPGTLIGPYKLLEQIGEGGMGVVYMAEQTQPVRRKVALKIIKPGMDTHQVIARFEAERQALALMDHPNIAKVLDAGATDLAADVMRYLTDQPVEACPPSAWYRFAKYARRHRVTLTTAALVGLSLLAGTAASTWQAARARDAQHRAESERDRAIQAEQQAAAIGTFLERDLLLQVDQRRQHADGFFEADPNLTVREALDRAAARIGDRFRDQPLLEAAIRLTIGRAYQGVAQDALSVPHLERSVRLRTEHLGPDHPDTLESLWSLAMSYRFVDRLPDAIATLERLLVRRRATLGPDDPQTINALFSLGETHERAGRTVEAERLMRTALARAGGRDPGLANAFTVRRMKLARGLLTQKKYAEAEPVLREVLAIRAWSMTDSWSRFYAMSLLGEALMGQGERAAGGAFILGGYDGMKRRESRIRSFNKHLLPEAAELVALYHETTDQLDAARRWRERKPPAEPDPTGLR